MFDFIFDTMFAWQQIGLLFMGLIFLAIGGGIIVYEVYGRIKSIKVKGRISAVRMTMRMAKKKGSVSSAKQEKMSEMYRPVFEYKTSNGEMVETIGSMASSGLLGKLPGKSVTLLVDPNDNQNVRRPSIFLPIFGLIFFLPGVFLMNMALTKFEVNYASILMFLALLGFIAYKIRKKIIKSRLGGSSEIKKKKDKDKGRILEHSEIKERVKVHVKNARSAAIVMFIIAPALAGGAYYTGADMLDRVSNGVQVSGEVIGIKTKRSTSSEGKIRYNYYSVVKFMDMNGRSVKFEDSVGSSSPMYKQGDEVEVLYYAQDPDDAIIDRGIFNWGLSGGLGFGALLMLWGALHNLRASRRRI